jgi:hypothetical protein
MLAHEHDRPIGGATGYCGTAMTVPEEVAATSAADMHANVRNSTDPATITGTTVRCSSPAPPSLTQMSGSDRAYIDTISG